jgi:CRISPR-associated protein Cmr3
MTTSKVWIIEPRDPFIARDGKPFGVGTSAATLPFPFPSTTTGGVRTRAGLAGGNFVDNAGQPNQRLIAEVKEIATSGALLVELDEQGEIENWFVHAPSDALLLEAKTEKSKAQIKRLLPLDIGKDGLTNLKQDPHGSDTLAPVGLAEFDLNKPFDKAPRFWRWEKFKEWLVSPEHLTITIDPKDLGHGGAVTETRTHVAIDPNTWTSLEGQLFQTRGLEFTHCDEKRLEAAKRLALAVCIEDYPLAQQIKGGLAPLGGERRVVAWRKSNRQLPSECLSDIQNIVANDETCRVVLLTPAYFTQGSRPTWLLSEKHNVKVELQAIANGRAQVISGWDFEKRMPKPTRRLAPAGSVYFLKLDGDKAHIKSWVEKMWMQCVSDDSPDGDTAQYRRDGFGLAAIGVWDGQLQPMKF